MKNYTNSDIFNSYIELSEKNGLISLAEDADDSKKALDKNPRADSLSKEKISKLYNVKPDAPKGMDYDRNIGQLAHKTPVIIGPSYDKLNALVESDNERQDILLRIVDKRTNGLLTQHKYARDEMVRSLVRIANEMDNRNESELCSLADECLQKMAKDEEPSANGMWQEIKNLLGIRERSSRLPTPLRVGEGVLKTDILTLPIGALLGAFFAPEAGILAGMSAGAWAGAHLGLWGGGLTALLLGTAPKVTSIEENAKIALEACNDILETERVSEIKNKELIQNLINKINYKENGKNLFELGEEYHKSLSIITEASQSDKPVPAKDVARTAETLNTPDAYLRRVEAVQQACSNIIKNSEAIKSDFKVEGVQGAGRKVVEYFEDILQNVPFDTYSFARFIDAVEALSQAISDFIEHHEELKEMSLGRLKQNMQQSSQKMMDDLTSEKEIKDEDILTSAAARRVVEFIKNS